MSWALLAGKVADDVNTNKKEEIADVEGIEVNSVTSEDILMTTPEKNIPSQKNVSPEEETKISQSGKVFLMYLNVALLNK